MKYKDSLKLLTIKQRELVERAVRKQKTVYIILAFIIAIGAGLAAYPSAASWWSSVQQAKEVKAYNESVYEADTESIKKEAEDWNNNLYNVKTEEEEAEYFNTLCVNDERPCVMGRVTIPSVNIDLPIYHSVSLDTLLLGVGHIPESHLPIGGTSTHSILSAHTGLPSAKMFDNLVNIKKNDIIYITVLGETLAYKVYEIDVVDPNALSSATLLTMKEGKDLLTLITCTPYSVNTHRLVVSAERTEYNPDSDKLYDDKTKTECFWCWFIPTITALTILETGNIALYLGSRRKIVKRNIKQNDINNKQKQQKEKSSN